MAHINNIYADGRVVVESTPSQFIFGAAASEEELQRNKDLDAVYDFIYGDEYDSGDSDMAEEVDENEVIGDAPGDSAWSTLGNVSSDLGEMQNQKELSSTSIMQMFGMCPLSGSVNHDVAGAGSVDSPSAQMQQGDGHWGETEVENGVEDTASSCRPIDAVGGASLAHRT